MSLSGKDELASSLQISGDLDEPEAALQTLARYARSRAAHRTHASERWARLAAVLEGANAELTGETPTDRANADKDISKDSAND